MSQILKEDLLRASELSDFKFINDIVMVIMHAERKQAITLSSIDPDNESVIRPIYAKGNKGDDKEKASSCFIKTDILSAKQKQVF